MHPYLIFGIIIGSGIIGGLIVVWIFRRLVMTIDWMKVFQREEGFEPEGKPEAEIEIIRETVKPLKMYWIYDEDDYFLGGNPCPVGKEYYADQHLKWLSKKHYGKLRIEWEEGTFTYQESYIVARQKAEQIQRDQPGIRENWTSVKLSLDIAKLADFTEVARVRTVRKIDAEEREMLGTHDQKQIDEYRSRHKQIEGGEEDHLGRPLQ